MNNLDKAILATLALGPADLEQIWITTTETKTDPAEVALHLLRLVQDGLVERTADNKWKKI